MMVSRSTPLPAVCADAALAPIATPSVAATKRFKERVVMAFLLEISRFFGFEASAAPGRVRPNDEGSTALPGRASKAVDHGCDLIRHECRYQAQSNVLNFAKSPLNSAR